MKVVCFGTFDIFHKGHEHYLRSAKAFGEVWVIIARDETVLKIKGRLPKHDEETRQRVVGEQPYVDHSILGKLGDKYALIEEINPDVICLGYDQESFVENLEDELEKRNLKAIVKRISAFEPHLYKSSLLRDK